MSTADWKTFPSCAVGAMWARFLNARRVNGVTARDGEVFVLKAARSFVALYRYLLNFSALCRDLIILYKGQDLLVSFMQSRNRIDRVMRLTRFCFLRIINAVNSHNLGPLCFSCASGISVMAIESARNVMYHKSDMLHAL